MPIARHQIGCDYVLRRKRERKANCDCPRKCFVNKSKKHEQVDRGNLKEWEKWEEWEECAAIP